MSIPTTIRLMWGGRSWEGTGELAEISEEISIRSKLYGYSPRTMTARMELGDVARMVSEEGWHYADARVEVLLEGELYLRGAPISLTPGRTGELTEFTISDRPRLKRSPIPSARSFDETYVDLDASKRLRDRTRSNYQVLEDWYHTLTHRQRAAWFGNGKLENYQSPWIYMEQAWPLLQVERQRHVRRVYQRLYGRPGRTGQPAVRLIPVHVDATSSLLMVAGHRCPVGTMTVHGPAVGSSSETSSETFTLSHTTDGAGVEVAVVDVRDAANLAGHWYDDDPGAMDRDWWGSFDGTASGLPGDAPSVLADLLRHVDGTWVDWASIFALRDHLAPYELDGVIDEQIDDAWDLIEGSILPLLPISFVATSSGMSLRPVRWQSGPVRGQLVAGAGVSPTSRPSWDSISDDAVRNAWTVRGAPSRVSREMTISKRIGPASSAIAALSAQRAGIQHGVLETAWVSSAETLERIAQDMVGRYAPDRRTVELDLDANLYGRRGKIARVRAGDRWSYTDRAEHLSQVPCIVERVSEDGGPQASARIVLLEGAYAT